MSERLEMRRVYGDMAKAAAFTREVLRQMENGERHVHAKFSGEYGDVLDALNRAIPWLELAEARLEQMQMYVIDEVTA